MNLKILYRKTFNLSEDEINFDSFIKFPLLFFRMILFDFESLNGNVTLKMKIKNYAKQFLTWFFLIACIAHVLQLIAFGVINKYNFFTVIRSVSDALMLSILLIKGLLIFLRKDEIRSMLKKTETLIIRRKQELEDPKMKKYIDGYYQFIKVYVVMMASANIFGLVPLFYFLINGKMMFFVNAWFPFTTDNVLGFVSAVLWSEGICYLAGNLFLASDFLLYSLMIIISMEIDNLATDFKG